MAFTSLQSRSVNSSQRCGEGSIIPEVQQAVRFEPFNCVLNLSLVSVVAMPDQDAFHFGGETELHRPVQIRANDALLTPTPFRQETSVQVCDL